MAVAVVALEEDESLASEAESQLSASESDNVAVVVGPLVDGAAKHGPYDVVIVQGAVEALPDTLTEQLKDGGRIAAIFMEGALGTCRIGRKNGGVVTWRDVFNATAEILPGFQRVNEFQL